MRISAVSALRRTLMILVALLALVSLYWNYKLHSTSRKQVSRLSLDSLKNQDREYSRVSPSKKGIIPAYKNGDTTRKGQVLPTKRGFISGKLYHKLLQLDRRLNQSQDVSRIIFQGPENVIKEELPLYLAPLNKQGYRVDVVSDEEGLDSVINGNWSALMCYEQESPGNYPCLDKQSIVSIKLHQKVSSIPGLNRILINADKFCYTMSATHHVPALATCPLSPPCYVYPVKSRSTSERFFSSSDNAALFIIRPSEHGLSHITFTRTKSTVERLNGILHIMDHPLLIASQLTVIIKMYVLVTSMSPLRVFRHYDGIAAILTQDKGTEKTWTLQQLDDYLSESFIAQDIRKAWSRVDETIVKSLIISESSLLDHLPNREILYPSSSFFQLLEFHFTFNSSLYPFLLEVKSTDGGSTLPDIADDTVQLLLTGTSSVESVHDLLKKLNRTVGVEGLHCSQEHKICLKESDLVYVTENHRQTAASGRFIKLYPVADGRMYEHLLKDLQSAYDNSFDSRLTTDKRRGTPELHSVLTMMESYRGQGTGTEGDVPHIDQRKGYWETDDEDYPDKMIPPESSNNAPRQNRPECDKDTSTTDPVLTAIYMEPPSAEFTRAFTPEITEYDVMYPFDVTVVKIWGKTSTCGSEARVNSRTGASRPANYSVGVGWNKFAIHLVDTSLTYPSVIVTYNINIYRQGRANRNKTFNDSWTHEMCAVKQDCDLKAFPGKPCGPQKIPEKTMKEFLESRVDLPWCKNGDAPGSWVVPCADCSDSRSCFWREAKWTPDSCKHKTLFNKDAKMCLVNKKILFVGDSTNRGMMYYLMEKINGSLQQWEKTHSMKVYSSALNDDRTSVSFAYYPQFWLPPERKPVFLKALQHLMARFMPLENSTNTILVVGGVQWLLPSHVTTIRATLSSLGLGGIKVIIKTLGSGFHLPVPGFVKLNLEGQQKVALRNRMVITAAKIAGFEIVDTYTMTVARYKEFLMGKCGCHFHKVVDLKSRARIDNEIPSKLLVKTDDLPRFHVIGPINSEYSEIIISRMCS